MPKVKLINQIYDPTPGKIFKVYGHNFVVNHEGEAIATVEEEFVASEVANGRYVLLDSETANLLEAKEKIDAIDDSPLKAFGYEVANYYGAKSLKDLFERLGKLKKFDLGLFAKTRFELEIPFSMSKASHKIELFRMIQETYDKYQAQNKGTDIKNED